MIKTCNAISHDDLRALSHVAVYRSPPPPSCRAAPRKEDGRGSCPGPYNHNHGPHIGAITTRWPCAVITIPCDARSASFTHPSRGSPPVRPSTRPSVRVRRVHFFPPPWTFWRSAPGVASQNASVPRQPASGDSVLAAAATTTVRGPAPIPDTWSRGDILSSCRDDRRIIIKYVVIKLNRHRPPGHRKRLHGRVACCAYTFIVPTHTCTPRQCAEPVSAATPSSTTAALRVSCVEVNYNALKT